MTQQRTTTLLDVLEKQAKYIPACKTCKQELQLRKTILQKQKQLKQKVGIDETIISSLVPIIKKTQSTEEERQIPCENLGKIIKTLLEIKGVYASEKDKFPLIAYLYSIIRKSKCSGIEQNLFEYFLNFLALYNKFSDQDLLDLINLFQEGTLLLPENDRFPDISKLNRDSIPMLVDLVINLSDIYKDIKDNKRPAKAIILLEELLRSLHTVNKENVHQFEEFTTRCKTKIDEFMGIYAPKTKPSISRVMESLLPTGGLRQKLFSTDNTRNAKNHNYAKILLSLIARHNIYSRSRMKKSEFEKNFTDIANIYGLKPPTGQKMGTLYSWFKSDLWSR